MRKNYWLILGAMLSTRLLAQQVTNPPPTAPIETPAPAPAITNTLAPAPLPPAAATNATAAKAGKKKSAGKKKAVAKKQEPAAELRTVPLVAGPATVEANNVNVRGKPSLKGDIITRVSKGQAVTVVEEIVHNNSGPEEPSAWAKIMLPANAHAWVSESYIDAANRTVKPKKLNVRSGPGENFSVIGQLHSGDPIKELSTKGTWMEIEPPTNAFAFVAAQYLKQEAPAPVAGTPTEVAAKAPEAAKVSEAPAVAAAPTETPAYPATTATPEALAATNALETAAATNVTTEPVVEEPPPKRIVQREGVVRGTFSIQAPTHFELYSPETGQTIDWLYTSSPNLDLRRYKGLRIVVTGEEGLEERWGNTPVITIQRIQVVDEARPAGS